MVTRKKRIVNLRDIAQHTGLSLGLVSQVLNDRPGVSDASRKVVNQAIEQLGYVPNPLGKVFNRKKSGIAGVVLPIPHLDLFPKMVAGMSMVADEKKLPLLVSYTTDSASLESRTLKIFSFLNVNGIILAAVPGESNLQLIRHIMENETLVVQVERRIAGLAGDYVGSDHLSAGYDATRLLLDKGHQAIGWVAAAQDYAVIRERYEGYCRALGEAGLKPEPGWQATVQTGIGSRMIGRIIEEVLRVPGRPRAFLWNLGEEEFLTQALRELGWQNGKDCDIVLFDADRSTPFEGQSFINFHQDAFRIGREAMELLIQRQNNPLLPGALPTDLCLPYSRTNLS